MHDRPQESDWKRFRTIVPELRERYLTERNTELVALLRDESLTPTDRFWNATERMEEIGKILKACLDGFSRSKMMESLMLMYRYQMIGDEDLVGFSEEVRERIARLVELQKEFAQQAGASDRDKPSI